MTLYTLQSNIKNLLHAMFSRLSPKRGFGKHFPWLLTFLEWIGSPPGAPKNARIKIQTPSLVFDFFVKAEDMGISNYLYANHIWEPNETKIFESVVEPGIAVLDIGAHFGYYSVIAAKKAGLLGRVFSFEPDPVNCEILVKNIFLNALREQIVVIPKAASHQNASRTMHRESSNNSGDRFLFKTDESKALGEIQTVRVDEWMEEHAPEWVDKIRVIKMDVEGFEPFACQGMTRILKKKDVVLFTELNYQRLVQAGSSAREYLESLYRFGFEIRLIDSYALRGSEILKPYAMEKLLERQEKHIDLFCSKP